MASLLKIVSTGIQDERLQPPKGQPDIGSFLTVMIKAGRYATNWTRIDFDTKPEFGNTSIIRLPTKGEMIGRIYLVTQMPDIKTQQLKAFYTRKPINLAKNYVSQNLYYGDGTYLSKVTFTSPLNGLAPPSSAIKANFEGIQLDDLIVGEDYTISVETPTGTQTTFSLVLSDKPLNEYAFDRLNKDTLCIIAATQTNSNLRGYSYNLFNLNSFLTDAFRPNRASFSRFIYTGEEYLGVGELGTPFKSCLFLDDTTIPIGQVPVFNYNFNFTYSMAYNDNTYVSVGAFRLNNTTMGQVSYSTDNCLTWSTSVSLTRLGTATDVKWDSTRNRWIIIGNFSNSDMAYTSTDLITWTPKLRYTYGFNYPSSTVYRFDALTLYILNDVAYYNNRYYKSVNPSGIAGTLPNTNPSPTDMWQLTGSPLPFSNTHVFRYVATTIYQQNDIVFYQNKNYKVIIPNGLSGFNPTGWLLIDVALYDTTKTYQLGEVCLNTDVIFTKPVFFRANSIINPNTPPTDINSNRFNAGINNVWMNIQVCTSKVRFNFPSESPTLYPYCIAMNTSNQIVMGGGFYLNTAIAPFTHLGTLIYSSDGGETWSSPTDPGGIPIPGSYTYAVEWTGSVWIAVGSWGFNTISISSDGLNWQPAVNPIGVIRGIGTKIAIGPSGIVIGGTWVKPDNTPITNVSLSFSANKTISYSWKDFIRPTILYNDIITTTGILYSSGIYILLGRWINNGVQTGAISVSNNGTTWGFGFLPNSSSYTNTTINGVATNGSKWIVVGSIGSLSSQVGTISVSNSILLNFGTDDWTTPIGPGGITTGLAYNIIYDTTNGFIVVGDWSTSGCITTSMDSGITFSAPYSIGSISQVARSICPTAIANTYLVGGRFNTSSFISVIISNGIVTSSAVPSGPSAPTSLTGAYGVAWNGLQGLSAIYVAVGSWSTGSITYSTDLISWVTPFHPPGVSSGQGTSIQYNRFQFIACGSWNTGTITISWDGKDWLSATDPDGSLRNSSTTASALTWDDTKWLVSGNWTTPEYSINNISIFSYGIIFTIPTNPEGVYGILPSNNPDFGRNSYSGSYYVGSLGDVYPNTITWDPNEGVWISSSTWIDSPSKFGNFNGGSISKSTDGIHWSTPYIVNGIKYYDSDPNTGVRNSEIYKILIISTTRIIMGAFIPTTEFLIKSQNGEDWSLVTFKGINISSGRCNAIAWNGTRWVAVGRFTIQGWNTSQVINMVTSLDGINWNNISTSGIELYDIVFNGRLFVTYGIGVLLTSYDGQIWSTQPFSIGIPFGSYISSIKIMWNGKIWLISGPFSNGGVISISTDGINWSTPQIIIASGAQIGRCAWNGIMWVTRIRNINTNPVTTTTVSSYDAIEWNIVPGTPNLNGVPLNNLYTNISFNKNVWFLNSAAFSQFPYFSFDLINWSSFPFLSTPQSVNVHEMTIGPFITAQPFDPKLQVDTSSQDSNGYIITWKDDPTYGTGVNYQTRLSNTNKPQYKFKATSRTQWLTFGTYYNRANVVNITLSRDSATDQAQIAEYNPNYKTDLVGPHFGWTNSLGHSLINSASITIGGNLVETIDGQLMEILDEFQTPLEKVSEVNNLICRKDSGFTQTSFGYSNTTSQKVVTPLPFWFSRGDPGCVLPIDALNVDEVRLSIQFRPLNSLYYTDSRTTTPSINVEGGALWPMLNSPFYYEDPSGVLIPNLEPLRNYIEPTTPFFNLKMPETLTMPESHLMVEYIYLDKPEANRFRIGDLQVPIVQHYILNPEDTNKNTFAKIRLDIPNPARDLFFFCQRYEAPSVNAHFLATRDLTQNLTNEYDLWWPDATGLNARYPGALKPGFSRSGSEPIRWLSLNYAETLNRYSTENVALFRSLLPSLEQRKAPWVNRYYYNLPFGIQNGYTPFSTPLGQANLDKIQRLNLSLGFHGVTGDPTDNYAERFWVRTYAETYNVFRVYGGRGAMMFAY